MKVKSIFCSKVSNPIYLLPTIAVSYGLNKTTLWIILGFLGYRFHIGVIR